jgi:hypothetical protein
MASAEGVEVSLPVAELSKGIDHAPTKKIFTKRARDPSKPQNVSSFSPRAAGERGIREKATQPSKKRASRFTAWPNRQAFLLPDEPRAPGGAVISAFLEFRRKDWRMEPGEAVLLGSEPLTWSTGILPGRNGRKTSLFILQRRIPWNC